MRFAVVGDTFLEVELAGHAERLCPDAPAPIVDVDSRQERAAGAGLVAAFLAGMGHDVELVTALSDDDGAARLSALLGPVRLRAGDLRAPTPVTTRITAGGHCVARVDEGCGHPSFPVPPPDLASAFGSADAIVVADCGRRFVSVPIVRAGLEVAARRVPLVWDPQLGGESPTPGAAAVTPSLPELLAMSGREVRELEAIAVAAERLRQRWAARSMIVRLGARGVLVCTPDGDTQLQSSSEETCRDGHGGEPERFAASLAAALARREPLRGAVAGAIAAGSASIEEPAVRPEPLTSRAAAFAGAPAESAGQV